MSRKNASHISLLLLMIFCAQALAETPALPSWADNEIVVKPVRAELAFRIGSDRLNEDFFEALSFAVGKDGQIYVLDSGNSRV